MEAGAGVEVAKGEVGEDVEGEAAAATSSSPLSLPGSLGGSSSSTTRDGGGDGDGGGGGSLLRLVPINLMARKAGAVAEAVQEEADAHRRSRQRLSNASIDGRKNSRGSGVGGNGGGGGGGGGAGSGPTLTGALRHSGVSAMVNMHLTQAERALRATPTAATAAAATTTVTAVASATAGGNITKGGGGGGGRTQAGMSAASSKWVWSEHAPDARPGRRGGWVEEEKGEGKLGEPPAATASAAVTGKEATAQGGGDSPAADAAAATPTATAAVTAASAPVAELGERSKSGPRGAGNVEKEAAEGQGRGRGGENGGEAEGGGGAECRRAVSAVIDTLDAGRASAAANLSIAQWKVVPLVLMTALGLGGSDNGVDNSSSSGGISSGSGNGSSSGNNSDSTSGSCGSLEEEEGIGEEEAARGAAACVQVRGPGVAAVSAREFKMLADVLLLEQ